MSSTSTLGRIDRLRQRFAEKEIDSILITQPENRRYLSGFHGTAGYLLITGKEAVLATDFRYTEQAKNQAPNFRVFETVGGVAEWFPTLGAELNAGRMGFEDSNVTFALYRQITEALTKAGLKLQLQPVGGIVDTLRAVKEPGEIELITSAVRISDAACDRAAGMVRAGMTEKELAWEIEKSMREQGSQSLPFDVIVASGPNSAMPHARPTDRRFSEGEPVVIDIGAKYEGYCSDLTRTICVGKPDATFKKVYDTVLGAQLAAIALIKEGMTGEAADALARTVIEEAGYGKTFGHALGHGVGLAEHEEPRLGKNAKEPLTSSMVFTIEPGIYLPGWGGVRIEDLAVLEKGEVKVISKARK